MYGVQFEPLRILAIGIFRLFGLGNRHVAGAIGRRRCQELERNAISHFVKAFVSSWGPFFYRNRLRRKAPFQRQETRLIKMLLELGHNANILDAREPSLA